MDLRGPEGLTVIQRRILPFTTKQAGASPLFVAEHEVVERQAVLDHPELYAMSGLGS